VSGRHGPARICAPPLGALSGAEANRTFPFGLLQRTPSVCALLPPRAADAETLTKKRFIRRRRRAHDPGRPDDDLALTTGGDIGFSISDLEQQERADRYCGPGKSGCGLLLDEGEPVGNWLSCLVGKNVLVLTIVGIYFDESDVLDSLVGPIMDRLRTYVP